MKSSRWSATKNWWSDRIKRIHIFSKSSFLKYQTSRKSNSSIKRESRKVTQTSSWQETTVSTLILRSILLDKRLNFAWMKETILSTELLLSLVSLTTLLKRSPKIGKSLRIVIQDMLSSSPPRSSSINFIRCINQSYSKDFKKSLHTLTLIASAMRNCWA